MCVSDRFRLTFYDTCADSISPPQIHTTAAEQAQGLCSQKKQNFYSFYMKIPIVTFPLNTNYEPREFYGVRMCESVSTDSKGGQKPQFQSKTETEITTEYYLKGVNHPLTLQNVIFQNLYQLFPRAEK